jgi:hypothetical protein
MKKLMVCVILSVMLLGCGEREKTKPGTAWLCVLENKTTGVIEAVWSSRVKPNIHIYESQLDDVFGYDDDETKIYEKRDVDLGNGKSTEGEYAFSYKVLDVRKINILYPKYANSWIGMTPQGVEIEDELPQKSAIKVEKTKIKSPEKPIKEIKNEIKTERKIKVEQIDLVVPPQSPKYTYEMVRKRGDDLKYKCHIIRNDGVTVMTTNTQIEAKKIIPFLK